MGRGAVNQKGPESSFLAALHAIRGAKRKLPVNLVLVAEGEEEIGSPHIRQLVLAPTVRAALGKCDAMLMPDAAQDRDGSITISLGAKGVVEAELVASGEKWGRGPAKDIHSSNRCARRQPGVASRAGAQHADRRQGRIRRSTACWTSVRPISAADKAMLDVAAQRIGRGNDQEIARRRSTGRAMRAGDRRWRISAAGLP